MGNSLLQTLAAVSGDKIATNGFFFVTFSSIFSRLKTLKNARIRIKIQFDSDSVLRADGAGS